MQHRLTVGLVIGPRSNRSGGETPRHFHSQRGIKCNLKTLSIFVDESGDFGPYAKHSPYYIICMVFHDQSNDLSEKIERLNASLTALGFPNHTVHTEPLIRREAYYIDLSPNERRAIFSRLFFFARSCDIQYKSFCFKKTEFGDTLQLQAEIAREISRFIRDHFSFFQSFEQIILYYDNGQHELTRILNTVLATELSQYDLRNVFPNDYKLFQVADLLCTLKLLSVKAECGSLSRSEQLIIHSKRSLKKDYLKAIEKAEIK